jgi:hypothetical protein
LRAPVSPLILEVPFHQPHPSVGPGAPSEPGGGEEIRGIDPGALYLDPMACCTWTGLARAHCARCHRTFASVGLFDQHQTGVAKVRCADPRRLGLALIEEVWSKPRAEVVPGGVEFEVGVLRVERA